MTLGGHPKPGKVNTKSLAVDITSYQVAVKTETKISIKSWQYKDNIDQQESRTNSLETQNQKLSQCISRS